MSTPSLREKLDNLSASDGDTTGMTLENVLTNEELDTIEQLLNSELQSQAEKYEAEKVEILVSLKHKTLKHFTSWGGPQGNCVPEDELDELIATLSTKKEEK